MAAARLAHRLPDPSRLPHNLSRFFFIHFSFSPIQQIFVDLPVSAEQRKSLNKHMAAFFDLMGNLVMADHKVRKLQCAREVVAKSAWW